MSKDILYLSTLIPNKEFERLLELDKTPQIATHLFSWKLFNSITSFSNDNFFIISTRPITDYPNCNIKYNCSKNWLQGKYLIRELSFINLPIFKTITLTISTLFNSLKWSFATKNVNKKYVFLDNYHLPYLIIGFIFSRFYRIPLIGVLTDPPNMTYKINNDSKIKSLFRNLNKSISGYLLRKLNGVIVMTKYLALEYCPNSKYIVIEAIGDGNSYNKTIDTDQFIIMYSGGLSLEYGIEKLLIAFSEIEYRDIELWFFGKGNAENLIIEYSKFDSRILYKGCLNNDEIKKHQSASSLLINPRPVDLPDGLYSFPSKILEYIESGTPALVTKLKGIPEEYNNYLFFVESLTITDLKNKICSIYNTDKMHLFNFGLNAKKFSTEKNIYNQGKKINTFLNNLIFK